MTINPHKTSKNLITLSQIPLNKHNPPPITPNHPNPDSGWTAVTTTNYHKQQNYPKLISKYTLHNPAYSLPAPILPHPGTQPVAHTLQGVLYSCRHGNMISQDGRGTVGLGFNHT